VAKAAQKAAAERLKSGIDLRDGCKRLYPTNDIDEAGIFTALGLRFANCHFSQVSNRQFFSLNPLLRRPPERHLKARRSIFKIPAAHPPRQGRGDHTGMVAVGGLKFSRKARHFWPIVCLSKKARDFESYIEIR
jgi:hypothetical protein